MINDFWTWKGDAPPWCDEQAHLLGFAHYLAQPSLTTRFTFSFVCLARRKVSWLMTQTHGRFGVRQKWIAGALAVLWQTVSTSPPQPQHLIFRQPQPNGGQSSPWPQQNLIKPNVRTVSDSVALNSKCVCVSHTQRRMRGLCPRFHPTV